MSNIELRVGVKILLENMEGKFLIVRRSVEKYPEVGPKWDVVGGRIDAEETLIENLRREVLEDLMDIDNTKKVLEGIEKGTIKIETIDTKIPTPFAFNLALQGYMDIMKIEDKHEFLRRMHEMVLAKIGLQQAKEAKL